MGNDAKGPAKATSGRVLVPRFQSLFLLAGAFYILLVVLLTTPLVQRNLVFLHNVKVPIGADFERPERYGLSPHKTVNLKINSTDDVSLGSWFTYSDPYFQSPGFNSSNIPAALKTYPTVLYLHGNAATRAAPTRVLVYSTFSSRLHVNVLAIDYRGFGDSTGMPTEEGTIQDATAGFDWLVSQGADPKDVLVVGHSLGAGIAAQTTARLARDRGVKVRGVVLLSGMVSIDKQIETFTLLGIPVLAPLRYIPGAWHILLQYLRTHYFIMDHISDITSPIMIAHARDDVDNLFFNSLMIFDKLLEPLLPPAPPSFKSLSPTISEAEFESIRARHQENKKLRDELVRTSHIKGDAMIRYEFQRGEGVPTLFLETSWGEHRRMPVQEGLQDVMREVFGLGTSLR